MIIIKILSTILGGSNFITDKPSDVLSMILGGYCLSTIFVGGIFEMNEEVDSLLSEKVSNLLLTWKVTGYGKLMAAGD